MSRHFGYKCLDCNARSGHPFNHAEQLITDLYWSYPAIRALEVSPLARNWQFEGIAFPDGHELVNFLREHYGHALVVNDEYDHDTPIGFPTKPANMPEPVI